MNRSDLQELADMRIVEAQSLLKSAAPQPSGAYYLLGYAVECALKACIAKQVGQFDFPDKDMVVNSYSHDLEKLVRVAGLEAIRNADASANAILAKNWDVVKTWRETSRYERHSSAEAQSLIDAIVEPVNGVLPWIKRRW